MLIINDVHELVALADEIATVEGVDGRTAFRRALQVWPTVQPDPGERVAPPLDIPAHARQDDLQERVFAAIRAERERQNATWGEQNHDAYTWLVILGEEFGELSQAILHDTFGGKAAGSMRDELVQLVAVGGQWLECLDRMPAREGHAS